MEATIAVVSKNQIEEVRVTLGEFQGHDLVSARVYATRDASGERVPTKKGLTLSIQKLPDLIEALQEAEREARAAGLLESSAAA